MSTHTIVCQFVVVFTFLCASHAPSLRLPCHVRWCVDAGWNMKVALATGVANAAVWLTWTATHWRHYSPKAFVFFVLLHVLAAFEVTVRQAGVTGRRVCLGL